MPTIYLKNKIHAPLETVFNLTRSIEAHLDSTAHTDEEIIGGRMTGLVQEGDVVTWRARHLGKTRELTSRITIVRPYEYFEDEMEEGDFKYFIHRHFFSVDEVTEAVIVKDEFEFQSPYGVLGKLVDAVFMKRYMKNLLSRRNEILKHLAECGEGNKYLL